MGKMILNSIEDRLQTAKVLPPQEFSLVPPPLRAVERIPTNMFGLIITDQGAERKCLVQDICENGAGISTPTDDALPAQFTLVIDGYTAPTRVRLAWQEGYEGGVEFLKAREH